MVFSACYTWISIDFYVWYKPQWRLHVATMLSDLISQSNDGTFPLTSFILAIKNKLTMRDSSRFLAPVQILMQFHFSIDTRPGCAAKEGGPWGIIFFRKVSLC